MKKIIITEGMYRRVLKENGSLFNQEDIEKLKRLWLTEAPENIEIVFAILEEHPDILSKFVLMSIEKDVILDQFLLDKIKNYPFLYEMYMDELDKNGYMEHAFLDKDKFIILENKDLNEIPNEVFKALSTQVLALNHNNISVIPQEILNLKYIVELSLDNNNINYFPIVLTKLPKLKRLYLANNQIKNIPTEILKKITGLEQLGLEGNPIPSKEIKKIIALLPNCDVVY